MVFSRLQRTLKNFVETVTKTISTKELSEEDVEPILEELLIGLIESEVAYDVAQKLTKDLKQKLVGARIPRTADIKKHVIEVLREVLLETMREGAAGIDLVEEARKRTPSQPLKLVFLGVNGVGKTTTIAKIAYMLKRASVTPVIVAADTFRAGAQEQLRKHAEVLNVPFVGGRYGADPASVVFDGIRYAEARGYRAVLIDTAGRMHTDVNLVEELRKIVRVGNPDYKLLVVDALTGNDAIEQARFFDDAVRVDFVILTKVDADVKGGLALSVVATLRRPILYIGTGQRYEDLEPFDPRSYVDRILSGISA